MTYCYSVFCSKIFTIHSEKGERYQRQKGKFISCFSEEGAAKSFVKYYNQRNASTCHYWYEKELCVSLKGISND